MSLSLFSTIDRGKHKGQRVVKSRNPLPCQRSLVSALGVGLLRCPYPPHERTNFIIFSGRVFDARNHYFQFPSRPISLDKYNNNVYNINMSKI